MRVQWYFQAMYYFTGEMRRAAFPCIKKRNVEHPIKLNFNLGFMNKEILGTSASHCHKYWTSIASGC